MMKKHIASVLSAAVILLIVLIALELAISLITNPNAYVPKIGQGQNGIGTVPTYPNANQAGANAGAGANANQAGANAGANTNSQAGAAYSGEVVSLTYMYADWCEYCKANTPILNEVVSSLGQNVKLNMYNEAMRQTDPKMMQMYSDYKARGLFGGFPTLVAKGKKGEQMLVGKQTKDELKKWICSQFETMPKECA